MNSLLKVPTSLRSQNVTRLLHLTSTALVDIKWRRRVNRPRHVMDEPEFLDRPDYSFLDGRPTPLGRTLLIKYEEEKLLATDAVKFLGQIEYALKRVEMKKIRKEEQAQEILSRKLKPKGPMYKPKHGRDEPE